MSTDLVVAPPVTPEHLALVKQTVAQGATDAELKLYLYDCQRQGVHPLDRLLHFTKRGGKYTPVTSIDLMRTRAADTGEYAGSDDAAFEFEDSPIPPSLARVTVWRFVQGQRCAFTATARWMEYCPASGQDHMWRKMPHTMLAKCAEALALRKGFPRQLAGLYAKEEMDQAGPEPAQIAPPARQEAPGTTNTPDRVGGHAQGAQNRPAAIHGENPAPAPAVTDTELPPPVTISKPQLSRFHAIWRSKGWPEDQVRALLKSYGFTSTSAITRASYEAICAALDRGPDAPTSRPAPMPAADEIFDRDEPQVFE